MGEVQGQGYIGQALGVADVLAVVYTDQLRYRAEDPHWPDRDRFLLSIGHYAIALYAALAEAGIIPVAELETYGSDGSRLPMSGMASYTPGMEISGGSLGHGLGVATGMALGLRHLGNDARVYNLLSDGELDEGSTWEAALACAHHGLDNVTAIVDVNALQADGPTAGVLRTEPITDKWQAFGWHAVRVDGNDIAAPGRRLRRAAGPPRLAVGADLRHPHRLRRTAAGEPGEGALHARRGRTNGRSPATSSRKAYRDEPAQTTRQAHHLGDDRVVRRPGSEDHQRPVRPRARPGWPRNAPRSSGSPPTWPSTPTCTSSGTPTRTGSSRWAWPSRSCSAPRPAWPRWAWCRSRPPTRCSPPGARTTSSAWTSPSRRSTSTSSAGCPASPPGTAPATRPPRTWPSCAACPNLTIVDPCDSVDIEQAVPALAAAPGPTYMRLLRGNVPTVLDEYDYRFELGKAAELRTGRDVVLISTGLMTMRALAAADRLEADHVDVAVLHVPTIKPLDTAGHPARRRYRPARRHHGEPHHRSAGSPNRWPPRWRSPERAERIVPIALPDEFLAAGALPTLHDRYGLSTDEVVARVKAELGATAHGHGAVARRP